MSIDLQCSCGKRLSFGEELAGARAECPDCGRFLDLPTAEELAPPVESPPPPAYRLASPAQISAAAFLGGPLAGFLLMGRNYATRGRLAACCAVIVVGVLLTGALAGIPLGVVENKGLSMLLAVPLWVGTYLIAKGLFHRTFGEHQRLGGRQASVGSVIGAIILGIGLALAVAYGTGAAHDALFGDRRLQVTPQEEVLYSHDVTEPEARILGVVLKERGYFDGAGAKTVRLSRDGAEYVLQCVFVSGFDDPETHSWLQGIAREVSRALDGEPVRVELCDSYLKTKKTLNAVKTKKSPDPVRSP